MPTEDIFKIEKPQGFLSSNQQNVAPPVQADMKIDQNLASGDLQIDDTGVFFTPKTTPSGYTVEDRMAGLLSNESPYIQANRAAAQRQAASRGLLDSTIAATAGQKAAIESSLPIAQQDAGFFQNAQLQREQGKIQTGLQGQQGDIQSRLQGERGVIETGLQRQRGDIESRLQGEQGEIQTGLYNVQGDISSRLQGEQGEISKALSAQGYTQQRGLSEQSYAQQKGLSVQQYQQQLDLAAQDYEHNKGLAELGYVQERLLAEQGYTHETAMKEADISWNKLDLQARMQVEYDRMDEDTKIRFNETTLNIGRDYQANYLQILADPNYETPSDRQAAVDVLNKATADRYETAASINGFDLDWGPTLWYDSSPGSSPAAPKPESYPEGTTYFENTGPYQLSPIPPYNPTVTSLPAVSRPTGTWDNRPRK